MEFTNGNMFSKYMLYICGGPSRILVVSQAYQTAGFTIPSNQTCQTPVSHQALPGSAPIPGPLGVGPVWNPRIVYAVNGYETGILPCRILSSERKHVFSE